MIVPGALVTAAGLVAVVVLGKAGAGTVPLVVAAALAGCRDAAGRRRAAPALAGPGRARPSCETAYALDAVMIEVIFVTGPLLVGHPGGDRRPGRRPARRGGARRRPARSSSHRLLDGPARQRSRRRAPLARRARARRPCASSSSPGCRSAATFGALDVVLPAFGAHHGAAALGGPLTAALAVGSALGGIAYGARPAIFGPPPRARGPARRR